MVEVVERRNALCIYKYKGKVVNHDRRANCDTVIIYRWYLYFKIKTQKHCKKEVQHRLSESCIFSTAVIDRSDIKKLFTLCTMMVDQKLSSAIYVQSWHPCFHQNTIESALTVFALKLHCTCQQTLGNVAENNSSSYISQQPLHLILF